MMFVIEADSPGDIGKKETARYRVTTCSDMTQFMAEQGIFYKAISAEKIEPAGEKKGGVGILLNSYFLRRYVQTLPIIRPSMRPDSAISRNRSLAYLGEHPACSATSVGCTLGVSSALANAFKKTSSEYTSANLELSDVRFLTVGDMLHVAYKLYVGYSGRKCINTIRYMLHIDVR